MLFCSCCILSRQKNRQISRRLNFFVPSCIQFETQFFHQLCINVTRLIYSLTHSSKKKNQINNNKMKRKLMKTVHPLHSNASVLEHSTPSSRYIHQTGMGV